MTPTRQRLALAGVVAGLAVLGPIVAPITVGTGSGFPEFETWWAAHKPDTRWADRFDTWYAQNRPSDDPEPPPPESEVPTTWSYQVQDPANATWNHPFPTAFTRTFENGYARIVADGSKLSSGGSNQCRVYYQGFSYGEGARVWFGGSFYISKIFQWSRILNLSHYAESTQPWYTGVYSDGTGFKLGTRTYGQEGRVHGALSLPTDQWFNLDIYLRLSRTSGEALTEAYVNGTKVLTSTLPNMVDSSPLNLYQGAYSYYWPGNGLTTMLFDRPRTTRVQ